VDDLKQGCLFSTKCSLLAFLISIFGVASYTYYSFNLGVFPHTIGYSVTCLLPMGSYLLMRNIPGYLRNGHSGFFAWFGIIFLELLTCQQHIWQSADGRGILSVQSKFPTFNMILTSVIFLMASHEMHSIKHKIITLFTQQDKGKSPFYLKLTVLAVFVFGMVVLNDLTNSTSQIWLLRHRIFFWCKRSFFEEAI